MQQCTVGGMVDVRGHARAIQPQLAALWHLQVARQLGDMIQHAMQRGGADELRPTVEGTLIGDRLTGDPTELAQDQAVGDKVRRRWETPALQVLDHQQAQDDLHGRRGAPVVRGMRETPQ